MSQKYDVAIVGAGLEGSVIYATLTKSGLDVALIDDRRAGTGSAAAGCLFKPSWLSGFSKAEQTELEDLLQTLYGVECLPFKTARWGPTVEIKRVDRAKVIQPPTHVETVTRCSRGCLELQSGTSLQAEVIIIAGGVWSRVLRPEIPPIRSLMGASLWFKGKIDPRLRIYAPYRQAMAFNISPEQIWFGDGTAIVEHNWKQDYIERTIQRAEKLFNLKHPQQIVVGRRPYIGSARGFLEQIKPGIWVATGGAKNGIALAALHACWLRKKLL